MSVRFGIVKPPQIEHGLEWERKEKAEGAVRMQGALRLSARMTRWAFLSDLMNKNSKIQVPSSREAPRFKFQ
jgi:hypothetical protein